MFERKDWTYGRNIKDRDYLGASTNFEQLVDELYDGISAVTTDKVRFFLEQHKGRDGAADPLLKKLDASVPFGEFNLIGYC